MEFIVLRALEAEPMCGYDIMSYVHDKYHVLLSPGSVYPLLRSMERNGFISETAASKKKIFTLTHTGRDAVRTLFERYARILALTSDEKV
ncbi:MAG: PadR family transcriptional regulator [Candidatus Bathyarchaeia archaeon]